MKRTLTLGIALLAIGYAMACTNLIVGKNASKDGSVIVSYNADSYGMYGNLYHRAAGTHQKGEVRKIFDWDTNRYLGTIDEAEVTYNVVGQMNENQVSVTETTFGGREELVDSTGGIDYGSLIYVALERSKTAREAIKIMTDLTAKYGYCSEGESFSICDPNEVWILELIGKRGTPVKADVAKKLKYQYKDGAVWVARRIPDGYVSGHANQARITQFPQEPAKWQKAKGKGLHTVISSNHIDYIYEPEVECVYAADVVTYARACGWFEGKNEDFSFADTYAPLTFSGIRGCDARVYAMFNRVNHDMKKYEKYAMGDPNAERMPLWIKPDHQVELQEVMNLMRDHYEGTAMDMTQDVGAGPFACPYRWRPMDFEVDGQKYVHERATSTQQTGFSFVAQCRSWLPSKVGGILWFGVDDTYSTCYCPMYCGITKIPECFREGNGDMLTYSATSAFWLFNRVTNFVYSRYSDMIVDLQKVQGKLEEGFIHDVNRFDAKAKASADNDEALTHLLNDFSNRSAERMMNEWNKLDQYLLVKYIDGNIKKEKDGNFERSATGGCAFPQQPSYPEGFYKMIVNDHGNVIKQTF